MISSYSGMRIICNVRCLYVYQKREKYMNIPAFITEWLAVGDYPLFRWIFCVVFLLVFIAFSKFYAKKSVAVILKIFKKAKGTFWEVLFTAISRQVSILILAIGIYVCIWNLPLKASVMSVLHTILAKLMQLLGICLVIWACCAAIDTLPVFQFKFLGSSEGVRRLLQRALKVVVFIFGIFAILEAFGLPVASLIAGMGIGGLVISLAAQDTASNLIAGLVIIIEHPFAIGDWIITSQAEGTVEDITFRSTKIRTLENTLAIVPNSVISAEMITNGSERKKRMEEFKVGVCYDTPRAKIEAVCAAFSQLLKNDEGIEDEPVVVRLSGFSDSSIDILIRYYTKTTDPLEFLEVTERINLEIISVMEENGVEFAFPSTMVYFAKDEPGEK